MDPLCGSALFLQCQQVLGGFKVDSDLSVLSGPAQGAPAQYSSYQQGQGQQYGSYRAAQSGPSAQQQRPYGYEQASVWHCLRALLSLLLWFCVYIVELYPVTLRAHSWLCVQESLLELMGVYGTLGTKPWLVIYTS